MQDKEESLLLLAEQDITGQQHPHILSPSNAHSDSQNTNIQTDSEHDLDEEQEMVRIDQLQTDGARLERISTMRVVRDFSDQSNETSDAWSFPIGWNRKLNPETGLPNEPQDPRFLSNEIQTAKYTCLNFIPYNLLHQISKGPNIYYLLICLLQMIKPISITAGSPTNAPPLFFLMMVSMVKDFFEDQRRRRADRVENNRSAILIEPQGSQNDGISQRDAFDNKNTQEHLIDKPIISEVSWHEVKTGQLIKVKKNEFFPADLVLLSSSAPKNMCFVETKNLDGETNLKHKLAPKELQSYADEIEFTQNFEGQMLCEPPCDQIYKFEGVIKTTEGQKLSLSADNLLLRGSSLRNTEWIIGAVVYTGHDTRIMRNSVSSKQKFSKLEKLITKSIIIIMLVEAVLCMIAAAVATVWNDIYDESTSQYLALDSQKAMQGDWKWYTYLEVFFKTFFTWVLLFTNMVPISLLVTVEIVKFAQAMFISWDVNIYDKDRDMPTRVQSSNLNEELGQISHIFSDKTGTLTANIMQFRRFSAGMVAYGSSDSPASGVLDGITQLDRNSTSHDVLAPQGISSYSNEPTQTRTDSQSKQEIPNVQFQDPKFYTDFTATDRSNYAQIERMLLNLALNHAVVAEKSKEQISQENQALLLNPSEIPGITTDAGFLSYNASSPDELALVNGARFLGVTYIGRDDTDNSVFKVDYKGQIRTFELLNTIEFSSSRKRMTSVFRDLASDKIVVMCKGADSVLLPLIRNQSDPKTNQLIDQTVTNMNTFAKEGLRTLLIVEKTMSEADYRNWNTLFTEAVNSISDRESKVETCAKLLEIDFDLVGSTALEDKLQDGVPDTIDMIRKAGIKLWVLTGDKIETAINIGYACKLLDDHINQYIIDGQRSNDVYKQLCIAENQQNLRLDTRKMGLIVSGDALTKIFGNEKIAPKFIALSQRAEVVLACRVSPKQKAEIVQMVRNQQPDAITMGIGDGANDVNMITQAHVGIGLEGLEGMQAARSSDYAISQFKYLRPLLFYHGREAYRRNATLAMYMFYKNQLFVLPQYWFGFASAFSGQTLYESIIYQGFNTVFTAFPIMWFAMFDEEFTKKTFVNVPKHFNIGLIDEYYSIKLLSLSLLKGIINGLAITLFVFCSLNGFRVGADGINGSFWLSSSVIYGVIVINANAWVLQRTCTHTWVSAGLIALSIASYFLLWWVESQFPWSGPLYGTFVKTLGEGRVWLVFLLALQQSTSFDMAISKIHEWREAKRESTKVQFELDNGSLDDNLLEDKRTLMDFQAIQIVQRESIVDSDGQLTPVDEIRRTQSEKMKFEEIASSMGDMNPLLERRGTIGYAFSQVDAMQETEQSAKPQTTVMEISPPLTPIGNQIIEERSASQM